MDNYEFVLATKDDVSEIMDIYRSLVGTPGCTWNEHYPDTATVESDISSKSLYVLKMNDKIVAVAAASTGDFADLNDFEWAPKNPCLLARLAVKPSMHKRGIGTIILENTIKAVKENGHDGIVMLVSKVGIPAQALYEKHGFERCGETFMYGIDFYRYEIKFS